LVEQPEEVDIDENSDYIINRKLVFNKNEMIQNLFGRDKMKRTITLKGNLSGSGLDKLTYPILKYEKEDAADLIIKIMTMMIRLQKCTESWKEGKVVMLPKPCNESENGKPENLRPIRLTSIFYRIIFGRIAEYFQSMHKKKSRKAL
jgi:hypothetical protein